MLRRGLRDSGSALRKDAALHQMSRTGPGSRRSERLFGTAFPFIFCTRGTTPRSAAAPAPSLLPQRYSLAASPHTCVAAAAATDVATGIQPKRPTLQWRRPPPPARRATARRLGPAPDADTEGRTGPARHLYCTLGRAGPGQSALPPSKRPSPQSSSEIPTLPGRLFNPELLKTYSVSSAKALLPPCGPSCSKSTSTAPPPPRRPRPEEEDEAAQQSRPRRKGVLCGLLDTSAR